MDKKIIVVTGEPSGDLQAGLLVTKIKELDSSIQVFAVGGDCLRNAGARIIHDIKELTVLGFFDVLKKLNLFNRLMKLLIHTVAELKPEAVILVDFSGFNLRFARKIHAFAKTIYYISPQVWASREGRIKTIKKFIDKLIVIFKFEQDFYKKFGMQAEFVGHPLLDIVKPSLTKEEALKEFGVQEENPVFALLPGSRVSEIRNILPIMLETARLIKAKIQDAQFIISKPLSIDNTLYERILASSSRGARIQSGRRSNLPDRVGIPTRFQDEGRDNLEIKLIENKQYDCLNVADFVLVASGSATLETAIMRKPNVVIYKMGLLNYMLYRPLVKIPFIGMENIVAGKLVAPEFIQFRAKPRLIADKILGNFQDKERLTQMQKDFSVLKENLGPPQAALRAAKSILAFLNK